MPRITVDDEVLEVEAGRTILQALDDLGLLMNGVEVPHYCWHPKLSIDGSCRLCQVEVEGMPKLQIACNTLVADGMVIRTRSERVRRAREGVMELLLVNHPLDCPICDQAGECKLQDYAYAYGVTQSRTREPRRALKKNVDLGPAIVFDQERCILCRRCVRFCREIPKTGELAVLQRGDRSVIETFPGTPLENDYSMNVADICPVGALTTRDFRFKVRVWFLEDVPGVCTGCARGCNVNIGVSKNQVYRYTPRRNDAVNDTWLCDDGRLSYKEVGSTQRIQAAAVRDAAGALRPADLDGAIAEAAARLGRLVEARGAGVIAAAVSPHLTNEELFELRRWLAALGTTSAGVPVVLGREDDLLLAAEKAPNAAGARALGFGPAAPLVDRIRGGGVDALLIFGHDLWSAGLVEADALTGLDSVVLVDSHHSPLEEFAHVVIPSRHVAEKRGTLTNCDGRVQRVERAIEPASDALAEGELLGRLARALGLPGFEAWDPAAASRALAAEVPAFAGRDLDSLPPTGLPLAGADA